MARFRMPEYYRFDVGLYAEWGYVWPSKVPKELRDVDDPPFEQICAPITF